MYLTRITLMERPDLRALVYQLGDTYQEHKMLWRLFEPDPKAERDFLYRRDLHRGRPSYFVLSRRPPVHSLGLWHIAPPKHFAPRLRAGQRLAFSLRVNPVVSRNGKRHDIVMDTKKRMGWQELPADKRPPLQQIMQQAASDWLQRRSDRHGFALSQELLRVEGYQQHRSRRNKRSILFSTLDLTGLLTVTDPEVFHQTLTRGIGPAKAFGCGLLLVRRP